MKTCSFQNVLCINETAESKDFINTFTYIAVSVVSFLTNTFSIDALGMVMTIGAVKRK